jgi:hypothetical protein
MRPKFRFPLRRLLLSIGMTLVIFGLYPYWWLDVVTRLQGGRAGNEGEGMTGFLIMIFCGLPGLLLTVIGLVMTTFERRK